MFVYGRLVLMRLSPSYSLGFRNGFPAAGSVVSPSFFSKSFSRSFSAVAKDISFSEWWNSSISRWIYTTNHKEIGILYIRFGIVCGLLGSVLS